MTITGSGFMGATAVFFEATAAKFSVSSDSRIVATAPAGTGTVDVTVTTPADTSATSSADRFNYYRPSTVTGLSPAHGPVGTKVTISGSFLFAATAVRFGRVSAVFKATSNSKIVATAPAGAGTVNVTVTTPAGTSATSSADRFTYSPIVTGLNPNTGSTAGGTAVTITGSGFVGATAVDFGPGNPATGVSVVSATKITCTSPAGAAGTVDVTVTAPAGTSAAASSDRYLYVAPLITVTGASGIADVPVANGTTLSEAEAALPTTVGITLSDGTSPTVGVTWTEGTPAYDGSTAGTYPFVGTLTNLPAGVTNPTGVTAAVNVDVSP